MKVFIIGSGGREHALAWKAAQSAQCERVYVAPGNAGTAHEAAIDNVDIAATDIPALVNFAQTNAIQLTIAGSEVPLSLGIVDAFEQAGLCCLGPRQYAAQLETSKTFSKQFMQQYNIPTAAYRHFSKVGPALDYVDTHSLPVVIKASGLSAGKGVIIAETRQQARQTVHDMLDSNQFGEAGAEIVIEEYLQGEEASFIVLADGDTVVPLASSQDHKARDDHDQGPNTGGMGAYSPAPVVTPAIHRKVMEEIIQPAIQGMKARGVPYTGFLYAGLMITPRQEVKTLEFNCRLGDPETQPIMMRLQSDLLELALAAANGTLAEAPAPSWSDHYALGIVLAAEGYPGSYPKGERIAGLEKDDGHTTKIFHAGTRQEGNWIVTAGGRVLCATALGETLQKACDQAYLLTDQIHWTHQHKRTDIGSKALQERL